MMVVTGQQGLMTTYREAWRNRGAVGWLIGLGLTAFYLTLYFGDRVGIDGVLQGAAGAVGLPSKWMLYAVLYSLVMSGGAVYYLRRHGNSRYNQARMVVNVGVQVVLGFLLPLVMPWFGGKEFYFSYFWPLKADYLYPHTLADLPVYLALYAVFMGVIGAPLLAVLYGKRWYCSWVCGCGALANTFGDPWRHLTPSTERSWRFERVSIHIMLGVAIGSTGLIGLHQAGAFAEIGWFQGLAGQVKWIYGLVVGSILSGVVGTAVYPILGPRFWCRNFCPMAAVLGMAQKVGRFRIRVKPDMCISCGNCTTYCEMGIDVRSYAENNASFTRSSCVGCGMCAHVCPRGVLRLENAPLMRAGRR